MSSYHGIREFDGGPQLPPTFGLGNRRRWWLNAQTTGESDAHTHRRLPPGRPKCLPTFVSTRSQLFSFRFSLSSRYRNTNHWIFSYLSIFAPRVKNVKMTPFLSTCALYLWPPLLTRTRVQGAARSKIYHVSPSRSICQGGCLAPRRRTPISELGGGRAAPHGSW
jgi:hypothetical protein